MEEEGTNDMANTKTIHKPIDDKQTMDANVGPIGAALQRASLAAAFELQDVQTGPISAALRRTSLAAAFEPQDVQTGPVGAALQCASLATAFEPLSTQPECGLGGTTITNKDDSIERMSSDADSRFSESQLVRDPFQAIDTFSERLSVDDTRPIVKRWGSRELVTMPTLDEEKSMKERSMMGYTRACHGAHTQRNNSRRGVRSQFAEESLKRRGDKSLLEESSWRKPTRPGVATMTLGNDLAVANQKNLRLRI